MADKPFKPPRMAPLKKYSLRPIEDPAEQAALDEKLRQGLIHTTASQIREMSSELPLEKRLEVLTQLMNDLPAIDQLKLAECLVAQLPPEALESVSKQVRKRLGKRSA